MEAHDDLRAEEARLRALFLHLYPYVPLSAGGMDLQEDLERAIIGSALFAPRMAALTEARLSEIEGAARADLRGNLGQQATARRTLELVSEVRRLQTLLRRVLPFVPDLSAVAGAEELLADLKRETATLGGFLTPAWAHG